MKKLLSVFLVLMTSGTFADVIIPCPATPDTTLNGKLWQISFREQHNANRNTDEQYHLYNSATKKITDDEFTGRISSVSLSYDDKNTTARAILEDDKEITLVCTGTYGLQRIYLYTPCVNFRENFVATISAGNIYKSCMSTSDNKSFTCTMN